MAIIKRRPRLLVFPLEGISAAPIFILRVLAAFHFQDFSRTWKSVLYSVALFQQNFILETQSSSLINDIISSNFVVGRERIFENHAAVVRSCEVHLV